jgi:TatD DNase family protein
MYNTGMKIIDTHCHIHDPEFADRYEKPIGTIVQEALEAGVETFVCVGTSAESSRLAAIFAKKHGQYASLALHPHEVAETTEEDINTSFAVLEKLLQDDPSRVVAIGECGLDYYYHEDASIRQRQQELFRRHISLALAQNLPLIFHIRSAFADFFKILDEFRASGQEVRGVVHSFTAHAAELEGCLQRGLYIGLNGIMTFTRDEKQLEAAKQVPLERLVLETDAPFLTPKPYRGKMCELHHITLTATFLSELRHESVEDIVARTTANATHLFRL